MGGCAGKTAARDVSGRTSTEQEVGSCFDLIGRLRCLRRLWPSRLVARRSAHGPRLELIHSHGSRGHSHSVDLLGLLVSRLSRLKVSQSSSDGIKTRCYRGSRRRVRSRSRSPSISRWRVGRGDLGGRSISSCLGLGLGSDTGFICSALAACVRWPASCCASTCVCTRARRLETDAYENARNHASGPPARCPTTPTLEPRHVPACPGPRAVPPYR